MLAAPVDKYTRFFDRVANVFATPPNGTKNDSRSRTNELVSAINAQLKGWDIDHKRNLGKAFSLIGSTVEENIKRDETKIDNSRRREIRYSLLASMSESKNLTEPVDVTRSYRARTRSYYLRDKRRGSGLEGFSLIVEFDKKGNPTPRQVEVHRVGHCDRDTFEVSEIPKLQTAISELKLMDQILKTPETVSFLEELKLVK